MGRPGTGADDAFGGMASADPNHGSGGHGQGEGASAGEGKGTPTDPVFWPRQVYGPDDLRNANVTIAALCFEDSCEAAYFEPCVPANLDKENTHNGTTSAHTTRRNTSLNGSM